LAKNSQNNQYGVFLDLKVLILNFTIEKGKFLVDVSKIAIFPFQPNNSKHAGKENRMAGCFFEF
jgi:hypothetical protein